MTSILSKYLEIPREGEGAGGAAGGAAAGAAGAGAGAGAGQQQQQAAPWHAGADAEIVGHWQNKGWDSSDPAKVAIEATRAHREAEKFIGAPADKLIRLPELKDEAGWKSVWQKLGAPAEAKDYDFAAVKNAAGEPIGQALADTLRNAAFARSMPKDSAVEMAKAVVKHMDGERAEAETVRAGKLTEEKANLAREWGQNKEINRLAALVGARRLGVTPEEVDALENQVGYARTMEMFRKVGALAGEDSFVQGGGPGGGAMTREAAIARKAELMNDAAWGKRYLDGGAPEGREMTALDTMIADDQSRAA